MGPEDMSFEVKDPNESLNEEEGEAELEEAEDEMDEEVYQRAKLDEKPKSKDVSKKLQQLDDLDEIEIPQQKKARREEYRPKEEPKKERKDQPKEEPKTKRVNF